MKTDRRGLPVFIHGCALCAWATDLKGRVSVRNPTFQLLEKRSTTMPASQRSAKVDLQAAHALLEAGFIAQACFAAQQCGEKAVKYYH